MNWSCGACRLSHVGAISLLMQKASVCLMPWGTGLLSSICKLSKNVLAAAATRQGLRLASGDPDPPALSPAQKGQGLCVPGQTPNLIKLWLSLPEPSLVFIFTCG